VDRVVFDDFVTKLFLSF